MKSLFSILLSTLFIGLLASCGVDNRTAPDAMLTGHVSYNGTPIGVAGTSETVQMQLFQDGYELYTPIQVNVDQEGAFSARLFDGTYKLVARDGNGPWENRHDTLEVVVRGNTQIEYPVIPYYTISNESFVVVGNTLTATFDVTQVGSSAGIESITLLVNKTQFVDNNHNVKRMEGTAGTGSVSISMDLSDVTEKFIFARVAVKTINVGDAAYSTVNQIK